MKGITGHGQAQKNELNQNECPHMNYVITVTNVLAWEMWGIHYFWY